MNIWQWKIGDRTFFSLEVNDRLLLVWTQVEKLPEGKRQRRESDGGRRETMQCGEEIRMELCGAEYNGHSAPCFIRCVGSSIMMMYIEIQNMRRKCLLAPSPSHCWKYFLVCFLWLLCIDVNVISGFIKAWLHLLSLNWYCNLQAESGRVEDWRKLHERLELSEVDLWAPSH